MNAVTQSSQSGSVLPGTVAVVPAFIADRGQKAAWRYLEFFTVSIRNPNTRAAYARAASAFFAWCEGLGLALSDIQPVHVAAWVEQLGKDGRSAPTIEQHLAGVRMLFDWLVVGQVRAAQSGRFSTRAEALHRQGQDAHAEPGGSEGAPGRDRHWRPGWAARPYADRHAVFHLRPRQRGDRVQVGDFYPVGKRCWVRLHEKGGKEHEMPAHHSLQDWLGAYIEAAGIFEDRKGHLSRTADGKSGRLTAAPRRPASPSSSVAICGGRGGSPLTWKTAGCSSTRSTRRRGRRSSTTGGEKQSPSMRWNGLACEGVAGANHSKCSRSFDWPSRAARDQRHNGKNGSGKSSSLRSIALAFQANPTVGTAKYVTPGRGGNLTYDGNIDSTMSSNPSWIKDVRRKTEVTILGR